MLTISITELGSFLDLIDGLYFGPDGISNAKLNIYEGTIDINLDIFDDGETKEMLMDWAYQINTYGWYDPLLSEAL